MLRGGADGWDLYFTTDLCHCGPSARSGDRLSWSSFTHFSFYRDSARLQKSLAVLKTSRRAVTERAQIKHIPPENHWAAFPATHGAISEVIGRKLLRGDPVGRSPLNTGCFLRL